MANKLGDLDDHLFAALDRLRGDLTAEQIEAEARRAGAIVDIADQVLAGAKIKIDAAKLFGAHGSQILPMLPQIGTTKDSAQ